MAGGLGDDGYIHTETEKKRQHQERQTNKGSKIVRKECLLNGLLFRNLLHRPHQHRRMLSLISSDATSKPASSLASSHHASVFKLPHEPTGP